MRPKQRSFYACKDCGLVYAPVTKPMECKCGGQFFDEVVNQGN